MADRILVTTDDLEHAVRSNAALEAAGFQTTLASLDEARQAMRRDPPPPPDCLVVTGGLHESGAAQLLALARDRSISTLGLVEQTEPDAKGLAVRLGLTAYLTKPADPACGQVAAGRSSSRAASQTEVVDAPVPSASVRASRGSCSSASRVPAMRLANSDRTW